MALPGGAVGKTLSFGIYGEPSFVGLVVKIRLSQPLVHLATGDVTEVSWSATVGADGTATCGPLPCNDDPAFYPSGTTYSAEWQALAWKPTPANKTFTLSLTDPATVDFDLIGLPGSPTPPSSTTALVGSALVGTATVG
jgi:hypothetical protein